MKAFSHYLFCSVSLIACSLLLGCGQPNPAPQTADNSAQSDAASSTATDVAKTDDSKAEAVASTESQSKTDTQKPNQKMKGMGGMAAMGKMKFPAPADMKFKDSIDSNVKAPESINELVFTNKDGSKIKMSDYVGKKNVILVFTEGFNGMLCPFCQTQTSRLVSNYKEFKERDCEVIVVYPGAEDHLEEFVDAALNTEKTQVDKVPFPIVLDKDFAATDYFDIHSKLAHPSTYLIDKKGNVQFAYVGNDMTADRPSIKAMLQRLDQLQ